MPEKLEAGIFRFGGIINKSFGKLQLLGKRASFPTSNGCRVYKGRQEINLNNLCNLSERSKQRTTFELPQMINRCELAAGLSPCRP